MEDYDFVLTQGPWMIGDSYLTIRRWVPNFVSDEAPIKTLTAWVRIPHLSIEYFDKQVLHKIGVKIGRVVKIDRNTESMDRGQYVRFCIEVDLSKPLLSKFKLNKRTWFIQYEGLKMISFKCGHLGHKEDNCTRFSETTKQVPEVNKSNHELKENTPGQSQAMYGEWMLVQRQGRKAVIKPKAMGGAASMVKQRNIGTSVCPGEGPAGGGFAGQTPARGK